MAVVGVIAGCFVVLALLSGGRLLTADPLPRGGPADEGVGPSTTTAPATTEALDEDAEPPPPPDRAEESDFLGWLVGIVLALVAAVAVGLAIGALVVLLLRTRWVRSWRGLDDDGPPAGDEADHDRTVMAESLASGATRLDEADDIRAAIIACYAALLVGLESCAQGRRPAETADEHLGRVLAALAVRPEPLRELTTLFGEARFSDHEMTEAQRDRARAALATAGTDLDRVTSGAEPQPEPVA